MYLYTLRFLDGRQPLCGIGVTSVIDLIFKPCALRPRIAESLPGPGPLTRTSRFFIPKACAFSPQLPAATCAAKGVDFLEPLKPAPPEVAQHQAFP